MKSQEFGLAFNKGKLFFVNLEGLKLLKNLFWCMTQRMKCSVCQASFGLFSKFVKFHLVNSGNRQEITRKNNVVQGGKLSSFIDQTIEIAQEKESTVRMRRDVFQLWHSFEFKEDRP